MTQHTLIVNEVTRRPETGPEDHLELTDGVNVLVGEPNTGKSRWLQMIDFILGNDDDAPSAFGEALANKYNSISAWFVDSQGLLVTVSGQHLEGSGSEA